MLSDWSEKNNLGTNVPAPNSRSFKAVVNEFQVLALAWVRTWSTKSRQTGISEVKLLIPYRILASAEDMLGYKRIYTVQYGIYIYILIYPISIESCGKYTYRIYIYIWYPPSAHLGRGECITYQVWCWIHSKTCSENTVNFGVLCTSYWFCFDDFYSSIR